MSESEWQPIETAPTDGTKIIACSALYESYDDFCIVQWEVAFDGDEVEFSGWIDPLADDEASASLTHWMPLPSPPKTVRAG